MKKMMNKKILIGFVMVSLALLLFSCGGQTEKQTTETATETITEEANNPKATVATGEPAGQGTGVAAETTLESAEEVAAETAVVEESEETSQQTVDVAIRNYAFDEKTITVKAGDTLVWTNYDSAPHTVTATDDSFDSGKMSKGDVWSMTFDTPGTYEYYCTYHPNMKATVIVE